MLRFLLILCATVHLYAAELPVDHPAKVVLDRVFSKKDLLKSCKSMEEKGFRVVFKKDTELVIARHPQLPGYIVKAYLASATWKRKPYSNYWIRRIEGAESIQKIIVENNLQDLFKAPKKWIYYSQNDSVLIEEDMELIPDAKNMSKWKNEITEEILDAVYLILELGGMSDSAHPENIPFSIDGKMAFVDTACHHRWPIKSYRLNHYLSPEMSRYWRQITFQNN